MLQAQLPNLKAARIQILMAVKMYADQSLPVLWGKLKKKMEEVNALKKWENFPAAARSLLRSN